MLESVALPNPPTLEPKANLKSPKDSNAAATTSAFAFAHEELAIRVESRDGDVLEVRRTLTVAAGYSRIAFQGDEEPGDKGHGGVEAGKVEKGDPKDAGAHGAMEWVRKLADEVEQQQVKLLETLLKDVRKSQGVEESRFVMIGFSLIAGKIEGEDEVSGVPDYWNAENTSDRIVDFATSFAGIFGNDPEFAETMVNAVAEGFKQAGAILGELPGAAGKLNRDTQDLVFAKLDKWLEEWRAGAYNQSAQTEITEAALEAA